MTLALALAQGSPRALGRAQGEAFADGIQAALSFYGELAAGSGSDLGSIARQADAYLQEARRRVPRLVEEVAGLAEGAGVPFEEVWLLNCLEEVWPVESCVTIATGHLFLHAEQWYAGHSAIGVAIARPEDGPAFLSPTCVGFLGAVGLSEAGYAQGIDSLPTTDDRIGIPRVLVSRLALGAGSVAGAIEAARSDGRAGGYAHVLATVNQSIAVETSATRSAVIEEVAAHTNHPLSPELRDVTDEPSAGSIARLDRAEELLAQAPPEDLEDCAGLLADHEGSPQTICLHQDGTAGSATVFGIACDLRSGRVIVSDGPPCKGRWEEFRISLRTAAEPLVG